MIEGWVNDDYLILFEEEEIEAVSKRYNIGKILPGFVVTGLKGWDDFIVRDAKGNLHLVPTVPLNLNYSEPFSLPETLRLEPDRRFAGKIKWYVKPIVFGGSPDDEANMTWEDHERHAQLVAWWNQAYREIKR